MGDRETVVQPGTKNIGLRGIVVADSTISKVDGEKGTLIYRGYDIAPLALQGTFEEVIYLLLGGELPKTAELEGLRREMAEVNYLPEGLLATLKTLPKQAEPMDVLQAMVPMLAMSEPEGAGAPADCRRQALGLICRLPLLVAAWERFRQGLEVVKPRSDLSLAANFLYAMQGEVPEPERAKVMETVLILHADHGFNASTFTARQIASTRAHIHAAIAGALGSLSGSLHGGANTQVYRMLKEIGSPERVPEYVIGTLDRGGLIMGMGHAVYRVTDPRAEIMGPMAAKLAAGAGHPELYQVAEEVRRITSAEIERRKGKAIYANVDFFSAIVNAMIGIPADLFTPVFAVARVVGWCAHYIEERFGGAHVKPTIYRPQDEYVGRYCGPEGCVWKPLNER